MRIIAIDPGYDRLGIAIVEKESSKEILIYSECFETNKKDDVNIRLYQVGNRVRELVSEYKPTVLVIEGLFFSKNTKTALTVSEARGVIIFQGTNAGLDIFEYTPNQIKLAVAGHGSASKKDVYLMVSRLIDMDLTVKRKDDEIDAIAVGLTFFASYKNRNSV